MKENVGKTMDTASTNRMSSANIPIDRIFQDLKLKYYKPRRYKQLNEDDPDRRLEFCETWEEHVRADAQFYQKIIWSGEARFHINGCVNTHNCAILPYESTIETEKEDSSSITVWGAIWHEDVIGPVFFDSTVSSENYLNMLNTTLFQYIVNQMKAQHLVYQLDGAPPHFDIHVRNALNENFPGKWMGRRGPILEWPARSPDLTPIDYFLWGYLKNKVYREVKKGKKIKKVTDLKLRITEEFNSLRANKQLLKRISASVNSRVSECNINNGKEIEV